MSILVTGGTGLIGSYVVREVVESGERPVVLDIKDPGEFLGKYLSEIVFIKGGIEDGSFLDTLFRKHGVDQVIHLAALLQFGCEQDPLKAVRVNIMGTLNLLEAARKAKVKRFVCASSGAVYGSSEGVMNETSPISADISLYGGSKFFCELLGARYEKLYGFPFISLRYFGVFGPGKVGSPGVAEVIKKIESSISGQDVTISEGVSPNREIHLVFVKDVAQATVLALKAKGIKHRVFNISGGDDCYVSPEEFYASLKRQVPSAGRVTFTGKGRSRGKADNSLAKRELGYKPKYSLEMGIQEDINYYLGT